jgi:hypothetical protein
MHFLQSTEDGVNGSFDLLRLEFILCFDLIIKLPTLKQLHYDIERILRFEHLEEAHAVAVAQASHHINLLDEALLSLVLAVGCLF